MTFRILLVFSFFIMANGQADFKETITPSPGEKQQALLSPGLCTALIPRVSKDYEDKAPLIKMAKTLQGMFNHFLQQTIIDRTAFSNKIGNIKTEDDLVKSMDIYLQKEASVNNYTPCPPKRVPKEKRIESKTLVHFDFDPGEGKYEYSLADGRGEYNNGSIAGFSLKDYRKMAQDNPDKEAKKAKYGGYSCVYYADFSPGIEMMCDVDEATSKRPSYRLPVAEKASQYSYLKMVDRILTHRFKSHTIGSDGTECRERLDQVQILNIPKFQDKDEVILNEKFVQGCLKTDKGKVCFDLELDQILKKERVTLEEILNANNLPLDFSLGKGAYMLKKLEGLCKMDREDLKLNIKRGAKDLESDPDLFEKNANKHPFAKDVEK